MAAPGSRGALVMQTMERVSEIMRRVYGVTLDGPDMIPTTDDEFPVYIRAESRHRVLVMFDARGMLLTESVVPHRWTHYTYSNPSLYAHVVCMAIVNMFQ